MPPSTRRAVRSVSSSVVTASRRSSSVAPGSPRWRGEGRFVKSTKAEAPLAVVGKVFDLEQPVSTKSFVFSEDTLTSVDEPPEASLVYADAPAVEVVVKTATARPLRGFGDGSA